MVRILGVLVLATVAVGCVSKANQCAAECGGCCDERGQCQDGNSNAFCGQSGDQCLSCVGLQACLQGQCVEHQGNGSGSGGGSGSASGGGSSSSSGGGSASSGGGTSSSGGGGACTPENDLSFCQRNQKTCGQVTAFDNCGNSRVVASCGTCGSGQACNAQNNCGCVPTTCELAAKNCGAVPNGCGGSLDCGACGYPKVCSATNVCTCTPKTCSELGKNCGTVFDGCFSNLNCGSTTCAVPTDTCGGGGTSNVCGCTPKTCTQLGATCGSVSNGCGGTLSCGGCLAGQVCGNGGPNLCGGTWTPVVHPNAGLTNTPSVGLIRGLSTSQVWTSSYQKFVVYNGSSFSDRSAGTSAGYWNDFTLTSAQDGWAVPAGSSPTKSLYRISAGVLTATYAVPDFTPIGIWAASPTDVWVGGTGGKLRHFDGASWTLSTFSFTGANERVDFITGTSSTNVFAGGYPGVMAHWNGSTWTRSNEIPDDVYDVYATGTEAFAVGLHFISHWDGAHWTQMQLPSTATNYFFRAVWGRSASDVWVIADMLGPSIILHWNGQKWFQLPSPTTETLYSIHGIGNTIYLGGGKGTFFVGNF